MRHRVAAATGGSLLGALTVAVVLTSVATGWDLRQALAAYVVSNSVIGLGFGCCGALVAWHRPRHPVGWLYLVGGLLQLLSAAAAPGAVLAAQQAAPGWLVRTLVTAFAWSWPVNIGIALPLSLALLPDGRLPTARWRPWFVAVALSAPLFLVEVGTEPRSLAGVPNGWWTLPHDGSWATLWAASEVRWVLSAGFGLAALVVRYRRGSEQVRRQLLWIVAAAAVLLTAVTPWALVANTPLAVLFAIPLLPAAIAVAILRHGLLDIRLVLARGLAYVLLSALVLAGYAVLVLLLSGVASALLMALLAFPLRARLQSVVERLLYGDRSDPVRVAHRVGGALSDLSAGLAAVREAMRLPSVTIVAADGTVLGSAGRSAGVGSAHGAGASGSSGSAAAPTATVPLSPQATLVVGLRAGERSLSPRDAAVLAMLSGPLAVAVAATTASHELQLSRERLVTAREEERRRLRRDLHDGLGPLLTGVALAADAAANTAGSDPGRTGELLRGVRTDTRTAIGEIRRLVDDLRPRALDELGLVAAVELRSSQAVSRVDGAPLDVSVTAGPLGELPAALEVASYRIVTEALTNAVRHSTASHARVRLCREADTLVVEVADDGSATTWGGGVGTTSMRERAEELGGSLSAGPSPEGGLVRAVLPVGQP